MGNTGNTGNTRNLGYRPSLDGLRGVSILAVVAFHLGEVPGGWVGVDVFFVLSGFLITTLLLEELDETGSVDLIGFWTRRARRLVPGLVVFVAVAVLVAWWASGDEAETTLRTAPTALLYSHNWVRAFTDVQSGAFAHTWSLAIEEQFYIVWPVVVALLGRSRVRRFAVMAVGVVVLWRLALLLHGADIDRLYHGLDTRTDALMVGAAAAAYVRSGGRYLGMWWPVGSAVIVGALLALPRDAAGVYAGGLTVIAVASATVIVGVVTGQAERLRTLLEAEWIVWLGGISYALYLWHVPLQRGAVTLGIPPSAGTIVAVAMAWMSTRWVESRFRRPRATRPEEVTRPEVVGVR